MPEPRADDPAEAPSAGATAVERSAAPPSPFPPIRRVTISAPLGWVAAGWADVRANPAASLFYGVAYAAMGWLVYWVFGRAYEYAYGLTAGFLLVGPFIATGLYDLSRRRERGERPTLRPTLTAWRANASALGMFAVLLTVIMLVWSRASLITFALFFSGGMPAVDQFLARVTQVEHWDFVATWFAVGALFATIVFAVSVVSVPMMLDRGTDTVVAALTSVRALFDNPGPLAVWALLIVVLVGAGFATAFVGLLVTGPVVGHATWHAYRALVGPGSASAPGAST